MGSAKRFTSPRSLELALVLRVGKVECHFPSLPSTGLGQEAFPIINLTWETLGRKDSHQGHHYKFDIGDGHAGPHCLFLHILHHRNKLGDAICLHVILHQICAQGDHVNGMQPPAVGVNESHDVEGHDLCEKHVGIFQIVVPNFVDNVMEKLGHAALSCLVTGIVIELGLMGSLRTNATDCCGIVGNQLVVEREPSRAYKLGTVVGSVLGGLGVCVCLPFGNRGGYC